MDSHSIIHGLWIGSALSSLELLTLRSFRSQGHHFKLWTYDEILNVPDDIEVMDANEIIPRDWVFKYKYRNKFGHGKGSYAGFSDIFRYKLLYEKGGIYVDMDISCLRPFDFESDYVFRYHHKFGAVGNIMKCPAGAPVMQWCYEQASARVNEENRVWELPINILNEGIERFNLKENILALSNIDSWPVVSPFISGQYEWPQLWYAIHWMNEEWRTIPIAKDKILSHSVLADLYEKHGIAIEYLGGWSEIWCRIKLKRFYYTWKNIMGRLTVARN